MLIKKFKTPNLLDELFSDSFFDEINTVVRSDPFARNKEIPFDVIETDDAYNVELMLAGYDKKDFNLEVDDNKLTITGERNEVEDTKYNHKTSYFGKITKTFTLPKEVIVDKIDAEYINGILKVTVPKDKELIGSKSIVVR